MQIGTLWFIDNSPPGTMISGAGGRYPAPGSWAEGERKNAPDLSGRGRSLYLEHETGLAGSGTGSGVGSRRSS